MIRNKLTQDILKKAGAHAPREAFAVLSVNGEYFGFCEGAMISRVVSLSVSLTLASIIALADGLEEHVDAHCTPNRQSFAPCPCRRCLTARGAWSQGLNASAWM